MIRASRLSTCLPAESSWQTPRLYVSDPPAQVMRIPRGCRLENATSASGTRLSCALGCPICRSINGLRESGTGRVRIRQGLIFSKEFPRPVETPAKSKRTPESRCLVGRRECDSMESNRSRTIRKNRVRELRENRLMTQAQLARKAKVALRTIHSVEKGSGLPARVPLCGPGRRRTPLSVLAMGAAEGRALRNEKSEITASGSVIRGSGQASPRSLSPPSGERAARSPEARPVDRARLRGNGDPQELPAGRAPVRADSTRGARPNSSPTSVP
jgi:hypothetical protein